ncbi:MAG: FtsX-like permease family protein [Luteitalea sp.]|nr:FtsX-like permease family protein [Luteitalea sp.]
MLNWLKLRLRALFRRGTMEEELDEELSYHLERDIQRHIARGMSPDEARSAVRRSFGNVEALKEESRDARGTRLVEDLLADLRYAFRVLRRAPRFAAVAVLTIALGIGANTAIFSVFDVILLKTMPVEEPGDLFFLDVVGSAGINGAPPYPCFERFRDDSQSFSGMAAFQVHGLTLKIDGYAERVVGQLASASYFDVLGVEPLLGRMLAPEDERLDPPVTVLSYRYWQRRFGGRPDVLGKTIAYRDHVLTIVGVTPPEFFGLQVGTPIDLTIPITVVGADQLGDGGSWWFDAVARLEPGVSSQQARAEIDPIFQRFMRNRMSAQARAQHFDHMELTPASRGFGQLRNQFSEPLLLVAGIGGLVLLIACANIANLLLARATARRQEFAVRVAIGAGRCRLVRQLLTESLLLFAMGSAVGLLFASWAGQMLVSFFAVGRNPILLDLRLDWRTLLFTAALCLITGTLFGLLPAVRAARVEASLDIKKGTSRTTGSRLRLPAARLLVVSQVALSVILLVAANLFVRTLANLRALDVGFRADEVLTFRIEPLESTYPTERLAALWTMVLDRVAIMNETAARFYFDDQDSLGARVKLLDRVYEVIGVAGDSKHNSLRDEIPTVLYLPVLQPVDGLRQLTLAVRTTGDAASLINAVRGEVRELGPDILVTEVAMLEQQIDRALLQERLVAMLSGGFGVLGLLLAAIGLYGVMSYAVVRRTNEIGVRMALGASGLAVAWLIVRETLITAGAGVAIGVPLSLLAARAAASLLFGVQPTDAATIAVSAAVLIAVAAISGYLPARRASRIDTMIALRHE